MSVHHESTRGRRVGILLPLFAGLVLVAGVVRADDFDTLINGWAGYFTGGTNLNLSDPNISSRVASAVSTANGYWSSLNTNAGRTYLWSDAASTTSISQIGDCYGRLADMALGWAMTGSSLQGNTNLAAAILSGLDWMYTNCYNEHVTQSGDWWYWEVGVPLALNEAMVLMYPKLSGSQITNYCNAINHFVPSVNMDGANRVWQAEAVGVCGAVERNAANVAAASASLSAVFPYVTSGDDFYSDGSYIFHTAHPYTGGYGASLISGMAWLLNWLAPTQWAVTDPQSTNVVCWCYNAYQPLIYYGAMAEDVRGREISRSYTTGYDAGHEIINAIFRMAQIAPTNAAAGLKSMVKYWGQVDASASLASYVDPDLIPAVEQLLTNNAIASRGELVGHFEFPSMDRTMHLRPGFGFSLSLFSSRAYNYESINGENLHGWFTSQGLGYLLTTNDLTQFSDNYWPTVDPYHLPGTTVVLTPLANSANQSKNSTQPWVGGAVLSNSVGAAGMSLADVNSTLVAKKSWFMFDPEVVCLGAGISCSSATNVHTTVENRSQHTSSTSSLTVNGTAMPTTVGWSSNLNHVAWCALGGSGGYYFPGGAGLLAASTARTGAWSDINTGGSSSSITRNYVSLILDHGVAPANATYAYVLLPNYSTSAVSNYAANPQITVLTNTSAIQAVRQSALGVTAANFWAGGGGTVDFITCNQPAAVITQETNGGLALAVSDPTWTNTSAVKLTLNRSATALLSAAAGITVLQLSPQVRVSVAVSGARGQTFAASFSLTATNSGNAPASGAWALDASGNWSNPANWSGGIIATGANMTATFAIDITTNRYVNNDAPLALGSLIFCDTNTNTNTPGAWFITNNPITLQVSSGIPAISVSSVSATIASVIEGTQGLAVQGDGTLVLSGANTYSGGTTVSAGELALSGSGTLGVTSGVLTLSGGTLDLGGMTTPTVGTVSITAAAGSGNTIQNGSLTGTSYAASLTTGNATVTANLLGNGLLAKTGAGTLILSGANSFGSGTLTFGSGTTVDGYIQLANNTALGNYTTINEAGTGAGTCGLNVIGGVTYAYNITTGGRSSDTTTGYVLHSILGSNTWNGDITVTGTGGAYGILCDAGTLVLNGNISNNVTGTSTRYFDFAATGSILVNGVIADYPGGNKTGITIWDAGATILAGANTYTGPTLVTNGTLLVNGSLAAGTTVTVNGGMLGGTGTINGPVAINAFGTLAPGAPTGTLTISNNLTLSAGSTAAIEINAQTLTNTIVRGLINLVYAGTLTITNLAGALAGGQNYKLFSAASSSGNFSSLTPLSPGANLAWKFNPTNGTLSVLALALPQFTNVSFRAAGGFTFSGTGPVGQGYHLLAATNIALPSSNWPAFATGVFTNGIFNFTDAQASNYLQRYYRLTTP